MNETVDERRGMKLIGLGSTSKQDQDPQPPDCGCEYIETTVLCDPLPKYALVPPYCGQHERM